MTTTQTITTTNTAERVAVTYHSDTPMIEVTPAMNGFAPITEITIQVGVGLTLTLDNASAITLTEALMAEGWIHDAVYPAKQDAVGAPAK